MNRLPVARAESEPRAVVPAPAGRRDSLAERARRWWSRLVGRDPEAAEPVAPDRGTPVWPWRGWAPLAEVDETAQDYVVDIEVPGMRRRDVVVEAFAREVRIRGESRTDHAWAGGRGVSTRSFAHRVVLPGPVDTGSVSASLVGGVLRVTAPKRTDALPRRVTVTSR